ncbi:unnamed protein product [Spirodela intermedia]|uniref:Uncharacterized protein n=2 Tax=Spirodela intermedia TaxID=51605 RepID=A0A7I8JAK4_SPIIN|nr:unnamed protein product [Spirodela intermedia]CAA6667248.1 unnamed protein product [Spirodela intermedia]CAA7404072.1 unnamed protein product [Spirodela intermedia]
MANHLAHPSMKVGDPGFEAWDQKDLKIVGWMWTIMVPEICRTCLYLLTAIAILKNLYQTFKSKRLRILWQEFDQYKIVDMRDSFDAALYREETERDRMYNYLVGLNSKYDLIRIQILGREKLPPLNEVIFLVRGEESCRNLMLGS